MSGERPVHTAFGEELRNCDCVGPMGNSPEDVRDCERWLHGVARTRVEIVPKGTDVVLDGFEGIVTDTLIDPQEIG